MNYDSIFSRASIPKDRKKKAVPQLLGMHRSYHPEGLTIDWAAK